jgi:hypothetical protein
MMMLSHATEAEQYMCVHGEQERKDEVVKQKKIEKHDAF